MDKETLNMIRNAIDAPEGILDIIEECFRENGVYWDDLNERYTNDKVSFSISSFNNALKLKTKWSTFDIKIEHVISVNLQEITEVEARILFTDLTKEILSYAIKEMERPK